jgi:hypothetical protein
MEPVDNTHAAGGFLFERPDPFCPFVNPRVG